MIEADLEEFLRGVLAVSAFREKRALPYGPGIFDRGLKETVEAMEKQLGRERVRLDFRLRADALKAKSSQLRAILKTLEDEGWLTVEPDRLTLRLTAHTAYAYIAIQPLPINVLERGAKILWQRLQVARLMRLRKAG